MTGVTPAGQVDLTQTVTTTATASSEYSASFTAPEGIDGVIGAKGYTSFLCNTEGDGEKEKELINSLLNRQVDGIVLIDPRKDNVVSGFIEEIAEEVPVLLINGHSKGIQCNYVLNDAEAGVLEALKYFVSEGIAEIAYGTTGADLH